MRPHPHLVFTTVTLALLEVLPGCGRDARTPLGVANRPPVVELSGAPAGALGPDLSAYALRWSGADPDGRVDHFEYAVGPRVPAGDAGWTRTEERGHVMTLRRVTRGAAALADDEASASPRAPLFAAVRAVDDRGAVSAPAVRAFFADNVAPVVQIVQPQPSALNETLVPPDARIVWRGIDPDGSDPSRLIRYKWKLFTPSDPAFMVYLADPDSIRRRYAPGFPGWDSLPGDTTELTFHGLAPNLRLLFVVVGFDEQGDYSAVFSRNSNMLLMRVVEPGTVGPLFTVFGAGFVHTFPRGGFTDPPQTVEVSTLGSVVQVSWSAAPPQGAAVVAYRWAIDIEDVFDETPRSDPADVRHWSAWSLEETSTMVSRLRPAPPSARRRLFLEARDTGGFVSLVVVEVEFVNLRPAQPLLIVNDTRLQIERIDPDGRHTPLGNYPNQSELDSLLFARGGFPWRGYPPGTICPPGVFSGWGFDTVGTRVLPSQDPSLTLETLARYRNVVWIVDPSAGFATDPGRHALRWASAPGRFNALAAYVAGGGRLWLVGGGGAAALCRGLFNSPANDGTLFTYSNLIPTELQPGRFMYDLAHWRSELQVWPTAVPVIQRVATTSNGWVGAARSLFPPALAYRSPATDPLPPGRLTRPGSFYVPSMTTTLEYLSRPNVILEDRVSGPPERWVAALDTVYTADHTYVPPNPTGVPPGPVMTVYHGAENGQVVFSGFDLWSWQRPQMVALVDAVLGGLWHLEKTTTTAAGGTMISTSEGGDVGLKRR